MINWADEDRVTSATATVTVSTSARSNGYMWSGLTDLNTKEWTRYFPKSGTYKVKYVHRNASDGAKTDIGLDSSTNDIFSQIDTFLDQGFDKESITTIEVARGNHKVTVKSNGKNASSGNYVSYIQLLQFDLIDEHEVLGEDEPATDKPFWEEIGRFDLTGTSANIRVPIKPKKYIRLMVYMLNTASPKKYLRFNNDSSGTDTTSGNYSQRINTNGGTDDVTGEQDRTQIELHNDLDSSPFFTVVEIVNIIDQEKLVILHGVPRVTAGEGNAPNRYETVGKWDNVVDLINEIDIVPSTSTFADGTTVRVFGHD